MLTREENLLKRYKYITINNQTLSCNKISFFKSKLIKWTILKSITQSIIQLMYLIQINQDVRKIASKTFKTPRVFAQQDPQNFSLLTIKLIIKNKNCYNNIRNNMRIQ